MGPAHASKWKAVVAAARVRPPMRRELKPDGAPPATHSPLRRTFSYRRSGRRQSGSCARCGLGLEPSSSLSEDGQPHASTEHNDNRLQTMTPVVEKAEHTFRHSIGVDDVEALLTQGTGDDDAARAWRLDLSTVRNVQPGAGYRLANAMRRWSAGEVVAVVPEPNDFSGEWFRTFTRSGIGLGLACHADRILAGGRDVTEEVRRYYESRGDASAVNYGVRTQLEIGALTPDIDRFAGRIPAARVKRSSVGCRIVARESPGADRHGV